MQKSINTLGMQSVWHNFLYIYLLFSMAIEILNGVTIYFGFQALNSLFSFIKLSVSIGGLILLATTSRPKTLLAAWGITIAAILLVIHQFMGTSDDFRTINITFKIFNNFIAVYFILLLLNTDGGIKKIKNIISLNYTVLILNIMLAAFGIGFSNYTSGEGDSFGGTGFLYAGNEVGVALLASYAAMIVVFKSNPKIVLMIIATAFIAGLLVMSKVTLVGVAVVSGIFLYGFNKGVFFIITFLIGVLLMSQLDSVLNYFQLALNRWDYLIDMFGWTDFLLGGNKRVEYILDYIDFLAREPIFFLIGVGWVGEAENNFFDLLESFGLLGLLVFILWAKLMLKPVFSVSLTKTLPSNKGAQYSSAAACFLILFISIIAGHTIQSSLITPFIGVLCFSYYEELR